MDDAAYRQYQIEQNSWLKTGRRDLIVALITKSFGARRDLEILDVGAGVGQNVDAVGDFGRVDVIEINAIGLTILRQMPTIRTVYDSPIPFDLQRSYDVIIATDVLEHIEDDRAAALWIADHLRPGGVFVSTVPAFQFLFSEHDVALHHYRRYSVKEYAAIMPPELEVVERGYFNSLLFPLAAAFRLVRRLRSGRESVAARKQSSVVPAPLDAVFRRMLQFEVFLIRHGVRLPMGLSVFCRAKKAC